jgi:hypothetical protein
MAVLIFALGGVAALSTEEPVITLSLGGATAPFNHRSNVAFVSFNLFIQSFRNEPE